MAGDVDARAIASGFVYKVTNVGESNIPPLYVKTLAQLCNLLRNVYPKERFEIERLQ